MKTIKLTSIAKNVSEINLSDEEFDMLIATREVNTYQGKDELNFSEIIEYTLLGGIDNSLWDEIIFTNIELK